MFLRYNTAVIDEGPLILTGEALDDFDYPLMPCVPKTLSSYLHTMAQMDTLTRDWLSMLVARSTICSAYARSEVDDVRLFVPT